MKKKAAIPRRDIPSPTASDLMRAFQNGPPYEYIACCFDCRRTFSTADMPGKYVQCARCGVCLPWLTRYSTKVPWATKPTHAQLRQWAQTLLEMPTV